jgi:dTDP-4-dehydrorhamnose reductase
LKILIIGGSSIVGFKMLKFLREKKINVEYTYYSNNINIENGHYLDIRNKDDVLKLIRKIQPTVVFHTSALLMDECELDHDLANSINVQGVSNLISACKETTSKIVYVSTSAVFNGDKSKYFETDNITPTTYYGITKGKAENLIKKSGLNYLILRTDAFYDWTESWHRENSVTRALNTIKAGKSLREVTDWYSTPTHVSDFVSATLRLIEKNKEGIFHLSGSEYINRYDWSLLVAKIFGLEKNIEPVNSAELNLPVKRDNINLNNEKLFQELGIRMKNVKDGLQSMLDN